jgi:hypothetical protein
MEFLDIKLLLLSYLPWGNGVLSVITAYLLSNQKVFPGRLLGIIASISWFAYGIIAEQYAFVFTQIIFLWIYIGAIIKFTKKRNEYRKMKSLNDNQRIELGERMDAITELASKVKTMKETENLDKFDEEQIDLLETRMYNKITRIDKDFH